jgi:PPIC-type PPIASE domain
MRLLRAPALHFVVLGGVLFGASTWWGTERQRIVLTADDVGRLRTEWQATHGAPPSPATLATLVDEAIDEEVLDREALARGLDRRDPLVHERLVRLGAFLGEIGEADAGTVEADARRLGLAARDVVIRRHLVQAMRTALAHVEPDALPSDADVRAFFAANAARFAEPARLRLTHVYLARDRHGARLATEATRLLAELRRREPAAGSAGLGDPFARGATVTGSQPELDGVFGPGFAEAVWDAPEGAWTGPIASTYGLHLVRIDARMPGGVPPLASVWNQVALEALRQAREAQLARRVQALRARYAISVESQG